MKSLFIITLVIVFIGCKAPIGTYHFKEGIELGTGATIKFKPNKRFKLTWSTGLIKGVIFGKWEKVSDTLILNSNLQPDSLNPQKRYQYLTDQKWLIENDKLFVLKVENGVYVKTICFE